MGHSHASTPSVPCPPAVPRLYLPFAAVRPGSRVEVAISSHTYWACYTHWDGVRTVYCPGGARGRCASSCPANRPRWTAYCVCGLLPRFLPRLLSWCAGAHASCPHLDATGVHLHRAVLVLRRMGDHRSGPLSIEWTGQRYDGRLPALPDVRVYLSRLWNVEL